VRNKQTEETFRNEGTAQNRTATAGRVQAGAMAGHAVAGLSLPFADICPVPGLGLPPQGSWFLFLPLRLAADTSGTGRALTVLPESA
jgi:hypothetical protein